MERWSSAAFLATAVASLALAVGAGCSAPQATVRYDSGGPGETINYDIARYQYARGPKVQIVLVRRPVAPSGTAEADFEYVYFELPDQDKYGWLPEDKVPVYRWLREGGRDAVWLGTAGQVQMLALGGRETMGLDFRVDFDSLVGDGRHHVFSGHLDLKEDVVATQGFINRYGVPLMAMLGQKPLPPPPPAPKTPAGTKAPSASKAKSKNSF